MAAHGLGSSKSRASPVQGMYNGSSRLRQESQDSDGTALFQHSPESNKLDREFEAGCLPDDIYDRALPPWRAGLRRVLVKSLKMESQYMGKIQTRIRGPFLDRYFYWTALFGTHTFFMAVLPMFFWFADDFHARGLLVVTGLGIWLSSFAKDLACCPRPFSPPVIRLSMSTHGLEYGFPSSHSANSVSIALFLGTWLTKEFHSHAIEYSTLIAGRIGLFVYAASVILGRMYCGMHSTIDCSAGAILGWICWYFWDKLQIPFETWFVTTGWQGPVVGVIVCLFLVHYHPEPVDDCPCFEDAIAILSVILGSTLSHWYNSHYRPNLVHGFENGLTPYGWQGLPKHLSMIAFSVFKLIIGIGALFSWRLVMKKLLHTVLPILFRSVSSVFHFALPTRKHYQAATEYDSVATPHTMNPLPSFVDLPSQVSLTTALPLSMQLHKRNRQTSNGSQLSLVSSSSQESIEGVRPDKKRPADKKHYDVDVLTKVIVYCGIPIIAIDPVRIVFRALEQAIGK